MQAFAAKEGKVEAFGHSHLLFELEPLQQSIEDLLLPCLNPVVSQYLRAKLLLPLEVMDEGVILANDIGQLRERPQLRSDDLINEMIEVREVLLPLVIEPLDRELHFALDLIHKVQVDEYVIVFFI